MSAAVEMVATPPLKGTRLPKFVPLILNCTNPVGVPVDVTVAVKVTDWVKSDGLNDDVTVVVVAACVLVRLNDTEIAVRLMVTVTS